MKKIFGLILCVCLLTSGCATTSIAERMEETYTFEIISEPSGAKIEINGNYIGETPLEYTVTCDIDTDFYQMGMLRYRDTVLNIYAYPMGPGYVSQSKRLVIHPLKKETIPEKVYFDMSLRPISNE